MLPVYGLTEAIDSFELDQVPSLMDKTCVVFPTQSSVSIIEILYSLITIIVAR